MRIAFLHDHKLSEVPDGGAQLTNYALIKACNFDVEFCTPHCLEERGKDWLMGTGCVVVNNVKFFGRHHLEWILEHPCFVKFERDYYNLADPLHAQYRKALFEKSKCNIFYSPLHYAKFKEAHNDIEWDDSKHVEYYSPVDPLKFHPFGWARRNAYACVGSLVEHKGIDNVLAWAREHKNEHVEFYGRGEKQWVNAIRAEGNCTLHNIVPNDQMPKIYNSVKGFIHLPNWVEPCGRVIFEARLCGCEIIVNERCGAITYPWFDNYARLWQRMIDAPHYFWDIISGVVNG